jgi:hypothetical protein
LDPEWSVPRGIYMVSLRNCACNRAPLQSVVWHERSFIERWVGSRDCLSLRLRGLRWTHSRHLETGVLAASRGVIVRKLWPPFLWLWLGFRFPSCFLRGGCPPTVFPHVVRYIPRTVWTQTRIELRCHVESRTCVFGSWRDDRFSCILCPSQGSSADSSGYVTVVGMV